MDWAAKKAKAIARVGKDARDSDILLCRRIAMALRKERQSVLDAAYVVGNSDVIALIEGDN